VEAEESKPAPPDHLTIVEAPPASTAKPKRRRRWSPRRSSSATASTGLVLPAEKRGATLFLNGPLHPGQLLRYLPQLASQAFVLCLRRYIG
jgi:hypothetical protein